MEAADKIETLPMENEPLPAKPPNNLYNVGDAVVKPSLGVCKIKAICKMEMDGKEKQFYVLQSGDVKVMVPFAQAHAGGLRPILNHEDIERLESFLHDPIRIPKDGRENLEMYEIDFSTAIEYVKQRNPQRNADNLKLLFYKSKIIELDNREQQVFRETMKVLSDEIAHFEHATRQKISNRLKSIINEGRRARKDNLLQ